MDVGKKHATLLKHAALLWRPFLSAADKARIVAAIDEAERRTTGEIHVHVVARTGARDVLAYARSKFHRLGLDRHAGNSVLILVAHLDREFAIWGGEGLHAKSGEELWQRASEALAAQFAAGRYVDGIEACVREVGAELARHFPRHDGAGRGRAADEVTEG